jgi:hypothetical protein
VTKGLSTSRSLWTILQSGWNHGYLLSRCFDSGGTVGYYLLLLLGLCGRYSYQDSNYDSCLMQEDFQCLGVNKTRIRPLHQQFNGMFERYNKTVEERLRKVAASHRRGWHERLLIFLFARRASTHNTTGFVPCSLVFGRELRLPCKLLFREISQWK